MDTRRIGSLEVSVVGLGCNNFGRRLDYDATSAVVDAVRDELEEAGVDIIAPPTDKLWGLRLARGRRTT